MANWKGTAVPNTGYVDKVYFNINLSVDEVVDLISLINYENSAEYAVAMAQQDETYLGVCVVNVDGVILIGDFMENLYFHNSTDAEMIANYGFEAGWNPNFNGIITINSEVLNTSPDGAVIIASQNDKLSSLFSITPFVQEQLTLNSFLTGIADAIRSKKGTTEKINASNFASEIKKIQTGIEPTGTLEITENGKHNVREYEKVNVNVASGGGNTLKNLLDNTKSCRSFFSSYTGDNLSDLISYSDTENVVSFNYMFTECSNATTFPQLDTSKGTTFNGMYQKCSNATTLPQLNTSNGTNFSYMYDSCSKATTFPQLDTSKGTNFASMYNNCSKATTFPQLDTSNGTNFNSMYQKCSKATTFPQLDTSKGTTFNGMYHSCSKATSFPQLDTSNGTNFSYMYYECEIATTLPQLNTSKGTNFSHMYYYCKNVKKIDISYYNISSSNSDYWCYNCNSLKALIIRSFGSSYTLNYNSFNYCYHILGKTDPKYNPNGDKDGYIYVPRDMIETLSSATNWSKHATQFRALEDYTKDGTTTGEFDDEKAGLV